MATAEDKKKVALFQAHKEAVNLKAEGEILHKIPVRVLYYTEVLENGFLSPKMAEEIAPSIEVIFPQDSKNGDGSHCEPGAKRSASQMSKESGLLPIYGFDKGKVPVNSKLLQIIDRIKPCLREDIENIYILKQWVTFLIPKIEDGNNFGVGIQEEILANVKTLEMECASNYENLSRYFGGRAKIVSKCCKYPHIEDYQQYLLDFDNKEFWCIRMFLTDIRNSLSGLYDLILKNLEKLKTPRTSHSSSLY
uniref:PA28_beta domain-containing protein n=1 Tax=Rhabditophanes sp. KR3021 TaxID=114890 RepID=A0AC35TQ77_9BILA